jgi:hypothetical protein
VILSSPNAVRQSSSSPLLAIKSIFGRRAAGKLGKSHPLLPLPPC